MIHKLLDTDQTRCYDESGIEIPCAGGGSESAGPPRGVLCYWGKRELGISTVELAKRLKIAQSTATQSVARGERIVAEKRLLMSVDMK